MQDKERLRQIYNMASDYLASGKDLLVSTQRLLADVCELSDAPITEEDDIVEDSLQDENPDNFSEENSEPEEMEAIIISCDASIKNNPGGPASVGFVIRFPREMNQAPIRMSKPVSSNSNNEAEYDAVYEGLVTLFNLVNRPKYPVIVRSDSKLVVNQLTGEWKINNESLKKKAENIHEFCHAVQPVPVILEWHRRNSTPDLTEANFMAQDVLGVPRH
jgi:ribonuclease HI